MVWLETQPEDLWLKTKVNLIIYILVCGIYNVISINVIYSDNEKKK